jgi:hypothetical protein
MIFLKIAVTSFIFFMIGFTMIAPYLNSREEPSFSYEVFTVIFVWGGFLGMMGSFLWWLWTL